jgi:hypothetical protein
VKFALSATAASGTLSAMLRPATNQTLVRTSHTALRSHQRIKAPQWFQVNAIIPLVAKPGPATPTLTFASPTIPLIDPKMSKPSEASASYFATRFALFATFLPKQRPETLDSRVW